MAESESLLAIGVDTKRIHVCLIEPVRGIYRLIAWREAVHCRKLLLTNQIAETCQELGAELGHVLWNGVANRPLLSSKDPTRYPPLTQVVGAASVHPPLRVWFAALSRDESLSAALGVVDLCQAEVAGQTVLQSSTSIDALENALMASEPELLIITGGYDNPEDAGQETILYLSSLLMQAIARMPEELRPMIIYAGNRFAAKKVESMAQVLLLEHEEGEELATSIDIVDNIRPTPDLTDLTPLAQVVRAKQKERYAQAEATVELSKLLTSPARLRSLEESFIQFTRGWMAQKRLDSLHALYCGSAWWLHVWSKNRQEAVQICFTTPGTRSPYLADWPPLQLASGPWPAKLWPQPQQRWWDKTGLLPILAMVGQVAPLAMLQVIHTDLLGE